VASSILVLTVALYASVATAYLEARRRREAPPRWALVAGPATVMVHLAALVWLSAQLHRSPFHGEGPSLSFLAFSLAAIYLALEMTSRIETHGGAFFACAAVLAGGGIPDLVMRTSPPDAVPAPLRTVHIGLALLGVAAALAVGILAVGYLGTYRRVKRREPVLGEEGPSLSGFERLSRRAALLALLFLGPSVVLGVAATRQRAVPESALLLVGTSAVTFVLLAVAGFLWWRRPLRGALAAWLAIAGTLVALLAFGVVHPLVLRAT
jgi:hypothetical protein